MAGTRLKKKICGKIRKLGRLENAVTRIADEKNVKYQRNITCRQKRMSYDEIGQKCTPGEPEKKILKNYEKLTQKAEVTPCFCDLGCKLPLLMAAATPYGWSSCGPATYKEFIKPLDIEQKP